MSPINPQQLKNKTFFWQISEKPRVDVLLISLFPLSRGQVQCKAAAVCLMIALLHGPDLHSLLLCRCIYWGNLCTATTEQLSRISLWNWHKQYLLGISICPCRRKRENEGNETNREMQPHKIWKASIRLFTSVRLPTQSTTGRDSPLNKLTICVAW